MCLLTILQLATRIDDYPTKTKQPLEVGRAWREWIEDFEDEISYFEITEIRNRVSALKIYSGKEMIKLARNLPDTAPVVGDDD